eukprot:gene9362-biopygen21219
MVTLAVSPPPLTATTITATYCPTARHWPPSTCRAARRATGALRPGQRRGISHRATGNTGGLAPPAQASRYSYMAGRERYSAFGRAGSDRSTEMLDHQACEKTFFTRTRTK